MAQPNPDIRHLESLISSATHTQLVRILHMLPREHLIEKSDGVHIFWDKIDTQTRKRMFLYLTDEQAYNKIHTEESYLYYSRTD